MTRAMIDDHPGASGAPLLAIQDLRGGYGRIPILSNLSFQLADGETVGILGHNGMGKTTLLRTLMGYLPATGGAITLEGRHVTKLSTTARARAGLGYVPQGREIFPGLSVYDNLRMGCLRNEKGEAAIEDILEQIPRLKAYLTRPGGALSGGEQQLLSLARCLCGAPRLILLDEPTEGIQPSINEEIVALLQRISRERGLSILLVEQNLDFIASLASRILVLKKGAITGELAAGDLTNRAMVDEFVGLA